MDIPPQFPPPERPEADDSAAPNSAGSEFLHVEPLQLELLQQDLFRAEAFAANDRQKLMRRLGCLLAVGFASFALVSWMLVRSTGVLKFGATDSDPILVVKTELISLARGDMQDAYAQLSERYRKEVPFANYNALVVSHRRMFLTKQYRVTRHEVHNGQLQIEAQLVTATGQHYLARFALVEVAGRWWIDDLHWREESNQQIEHM
jgi:hypothetical protein